MRVIMKADGRVFEGTPLQIVRQMQELAFGWEGRPVAEYIDWVAEQLGRMEGVHLVVQGLGDEERARSLVEGALAAGVMSKA